MQERLHYGELAAGIRGLDFTDALCALRNAGLPFDSARAVVRWERERRYLRIVRWAERRYCDPETGELLIAIGREPSVYTRIEHAAWRRYMEQ